MSPLTPRISRPETMSITLLLDLDDTLLNNDINRFLPHYLAALGKHLAQYVPPEKMTKELLAATSKMAANENPGVTLEEAFDSHFYPHIGVSKQQLVSVLAEFYEDVFPTLRHLTSPKPEAIRLVESALSNGNKVAIATNPLFPLRAIQHRLDWAGLNVETHAFDVITTYEGFHFAKPNPAYYAEILARLGWPDGPAVMVGNSLSDDLLPAEKLNLPGFWLADGSDGQPEGPLSGKGALEDVLPWLEQVQSAFTPGAYTREGILAVLKSTPAVLDTLARSLHPDEWGLIPQPGEWCFTEIICHLRDADQEINIPRFNRILDTSNTFLPSVNADAWSETRAYCKENGPLALAGFIQSRVELIHKLESLHDNEWKKPARHAIFGPTTLQELTVFIVQHDQTHIQQALKTVRRSQ
jgi:FMN phosphatase YigB (HAD superfamily)